MRPGSTPPPPPQPPALPALPARRRWLAAASLLATAPAAVATSATSTTTLPPELSQALPEAQLRGSASMVFLGMLVYDVRLWAPQPPAPDPSSQPLALELVYARRLVGKRIAERSLGEMRRIGEFSNAQADRWLQAMLQLFPDVQAGDRLTGVQQPGRGARFFHNGRARGEVADADFARLFFGIWLSPRTSEPKLRQQLLGG